jgi:hypothetical protein
MDGALPATNHTKVVAKTNNDADERTGCVLAFINAAVRLSGKVSHSFQVTSESDDEVEPVANS